MEEERSSGIEYTLEEIANTEPDLVETHTDKPFELPDFLKPGQTEEMKSDANVNPQTDITGLPDFLKPGYTPPEQPAVPIGSNTPQFNGHPKDYLEFLMKTK
jgi:hypothetical protein